MHNDLQSYLKRLYRFKRKPITNYLTPVDRLRASIAHSKLMASLSRGPTCCRNQRMSCALAQAPGSIFKDTAHE
jgi:hypothetical protein